MNSNRAPLTGRARCHRPPAPGTGPTGAHRKVVVYEPTGRSRRPFWRYVAEVWGWRPFLWQLARSELKARHYDTALGRVWVVLNPLLLALVYFLLFTVIREGGRGADFMAQVIAGIFFYYFTRNSLQLGGRSLLGGQRLILNTSLPRAVLPLAAVVGAGYVFIPTFTVYLVLHVVLGQPVTLALLFLPVLFALLALFNVGAALFLSAISVAFRDTSEALPYLLRLWIYVTPILYESTEAPPRILPYLRLNPLYPTFTALQAVLDGQAPEAGLLLAGLGWGLGALCIGGFVFLTRERDLAADL